MVNKELERLKAVKRFERFNFVLHKGLQSILEIAADVYHTPAAFITLVDEEDQFFKVNHGFEVLTMPRDTSFCTHTILLHEPFIVCDALKDDRFSDNPFVQNAPNIRFYAGAALSDHQGHNIGTICVMDTEPKEIDAEKRRMLLILARQAINLMELEMNYKLVTDRLEQVEQHNAALRDMAFIQSYEFRIPLGKIKGLINTIKQNDYKAPEESITVIEDVVTKLDEKIKTVEESTEAVRNALMSV